MSVSSNSNLTSTSTSTLRTPSKDIASTFTTIPSLIMQSLPISFETMNNPTDLGTLSEQKTIAPISLPHDSNQIDLFIKELEKFKQHILQSVEQTVIVQNNRQMQTAFLQMKAAGLSDCTILYNAVKNEDFKFLEFILTGPLKNKIDINNYDDEGRCVLHYAVELGYEQYVNFLIDHRANPNALEKNGNKFSPLHIAVSCKNLNMTKCLVKRNAMVDIETNCEERFTPLHLAAQNGEKDIVSFLLDKHACVNQVSTMTNSTPLSLAAAHDRSEVVTILVDHGADLSIANTMGQTPLAIARNNGNTTIVDALNDHLKTGKPPLQTYQKISYQVLLEPFPESEKDVSKNLIKAAAEGHLHKVIGLVQRGAHVNYLWKKRSPALHWAASLGFVQIVEFLLGNGANVNLRDKQKGYTPLHYAARNGKTETAQMLIKKKALINIYGMRGEKEDRSLFGENTFHTPLSLAVIGGHEEMVKLLLANGANPNIIIKNTGETAFSLAKEKNLTSIVNILAPYMRSVFQIADNIHEFLIPAPVASDVSDYENLETAIKRKNVILFMGYFERNDATRRRILINFQDNSKAKVSLLHLAIHGKANKIVEYLLKNGADANLRDFRNNYTPLHSSVDEDNTEATKMLIENHAVVNQPGLTTYRTPLHVAAENNHTGSLQLLLDNGADPTIIDVTGETPYAIAKRRNYVECIKLLEDHRKKPTQMSTITNFSNKFGIPISIFDSIEASRKEFEVSDKSFKYSIRSGDWCSVIYCFIKRNNITKVVAQNTIQIANRNNHVRIVLFLLEQDVKYTTVEYGQITALHYTAIRNLPFECKRLLDEGADPYKKSGSLFTLSKKCKTVREIAEEKQFADVLEVLDEYEKNIAEKAMKTNSAKKSNVKSKSKSNMESNIGRTDEEIPLLEAAEVDLTPNTLRPIYKPPKK